MCIGVLWRDLSKKTRLVNMSKKSPKKNRARAPNLQMSRRTDACSVTMYLPSAPKKVSHWLSELISRCGAPKHPFPGFLFIHAVLLVFPVRASFRSLYF